MDKILMSLISTAWGKNLIMWFFAILVLGCACLGWAYIALLKDLHDCNEAHFLEQKRFSLEKEALIREQITYIQQAIKRVEDLEKTEKK